MQERNKAGDKELREEENLSATDWWTTNVFILLLASGCFLGVIIWVYLLLFRRLDALAYLKRPSPRGLLYVPPEIEALVDQQVRDKPSLADKRHELINAYTLRYYFGGQEVACRHGSQGVAVLAVGKPEIESLLSKITAAEKELIRVEQPELWGTGPIDL